MSQCTNIKHLSNHQEEVGWGENHKPQLKLCIKKIWRELDSDKLLCIKIIESIPLRLAADITAREENKYTKKTIKTKFDSDETWTKVVHIYIYLIPVNCLWDVIIIVKLLYIQKPWFFLLNLWYNLPFKGPFTYLGNFRVNWTVYSLLIGNSLPFQRQLWPEKKPIFRSEFERKGTVPLYRH